MQSKLALLKTKTARLILAASVILVPLAAKADVLEDRSADITGPVSMSEGGLFDLIFKILNWLLGLVGLAAFVMLLYGGFLYLTAGANEEAPKKAKNVIMYAVIGLVVIALAYAVVSYFKGFAGTEVTTS